jgi:hypothetical protein
LLFFWLQLAAIDLAASEENIANAMKLIDTTGSLSASSSFSSHSFSSFSSLVISWRTTSVLFELLSHPFLCGEGRAPDDDEQSLIGECLQGWFAC